MSFSKDIPWTSNYYRVGYDVCIWICHTCGNMFDSELCKGFTGQCYSCYPRPDEMKGDLKELEAYESRKEQDE